MACYDDCYAVFLLHSQLSENRNSEYLVGLVQLEERSSKRQIYFIIINNSHLQLKTVTVSHVQVRAQGVRTLQVSI